MSEESSLRLRLPSQRWRTDLVFHEGLRSLESFGQLIRPVPCHVSSVDNFVRPV